MEAFLPFAVIMKTISREKFVKMQEQMDELLRNEDTADWGELLTKAHEISRVYEAMWEERYWEEFLDVINFDVLGGVEIKTSNIGCGKLYQGAAMAIWKKETLPERMGLLFLKRKNKPMNIGELAKQLQCREDVVGSFVWRQDGKQMKEDKGGLWSLMKETYAKEQLDAKQKIQPPEGGW